MSLDKYHRKRRFDRTPEPKGRSAKKDHSLRFVVQKHAASRLHYDFRLEMDGVLKSWAVPKGPSMNPNDKHLAVMVEDHPYDYKDFTGIIPEGNYGAGVVEIWDEGTYVPLGAHDEKTDENAAVESLRKGELKFILNGHKLHGAFALVHMHKGDDGKNWLLIKMKDAEAQDKPYDISRTRPVHPVSASVKKSADEKKA